MSVCESFELKDRYGDEYTSYIQQAGAYYLGERDYTRLSSYIGPINDPAGHIWHYLPAYIFHLYSN